MKGEQMLCVCLKQKGILFTCCTVNKGIKVKDDLPCWRMERVLDLEVVTLNVPGFEGKERRQCFYCLIRR